MAQRYGRWEDAMIQQTALLEWSQNTLGARYLRTFFEDQNAKHTSAARKDPRQMAALQVEMLRMGEPVYVSEEVTELIDHARKSWREERVLPGDVFTPNGFVWFPRPILIDDMPPTKECPLRSVPVGDMLHGFIPIRAMSWASIHSEDLSLGTYWISFYTHVDDEFDLADELGAPSRFDLPGPDGARIPRDEARQLIPLSLVHQWQWSWGTDGAIERDWDDPKRYDVLPEDSIEHMIARAKQQCALVQTTWRIAQQLVPAKERPQRQWWRDANRKGIEAKDVTVIRLRRTRPQREYEPSDRELTCRFVVRGHWRKQWYATIQDHRQIWIAPFVKGPEDAPFRKTERAWELTR